MNEAMKKILLGTALWIGLMSGAQTNSPTLSLEAFAEAQNQECPFELSQGVTEKSVSVDAGQLIILLEVDNSVIPFESLRERQALLHDAKVAELATDSSQDSLRKICADDGVAIVYRFTDGTDSFSITILPSDL